MSLVLLLVEVKIALLRYGKEYMSVKPRHSNLLKDALKSDTSTVETELWSPLPDQGWRPCGINYADEKPANSSGYLQVFLDGGLNRQRMGICDDVAIAKILNATLVIPLLEVNPVWKDSSSFEEIFYVDHFIDALKDDVNIVKELPFEYAWSTREFYSTAIRETRVKLHPCMRF